MPDRGLLSRPPACAFGRGDEDEVAAGVRDALAVGRRISPERDVGASVRESNATTKARLRCGPAPGLVRFPYRRLRPTDRLVVGRLFAPATESPGENTGAAYAIPFAGWFPIKPVFVH